MNLATFSNAKDPNNRSKKDCVCGCHSMKAKNSKKNKKKRIRPPHRKEIDIEEDVIDNDLPVVYDFDCFCG